MLGTLLPLMLKEPLGPAEPTTRLGQIPSNAQVKPQPARTPRGPPRITALGIQLLGALQRPETVLQVAER